MPLVPCAVFARMTINVLLKLCLVVSAAMERLHAALITLHFIDFFTTLSRTTSARVVDGVSLLANGASHLHSHGHHSVLFHFIPTLATVLPVVYFLVSSVPTISDKSPLTLSGWWVPP